MKLTMRGNSHPSHRVDIPLDRSTITGHITCPTLEAMLIREVHLSSKQFKEASGADLNKAVVSHPTHFSRSPGYEEFYQP